MRAYQSAARVNSGETGSVIVEFALTLPLLILIVVGIFDFGMLFREELLVTNAAREGARMASLPGYQLADVDRRVRDYLTLNNVSATPTITLDNASFTPNVGDVFNVRTVSVTFDHEFAFFAPVARIFGGTLATIPVRGVATMRTETAAGGP